MYSFSIEEEFYHSIISKDEELLKIVDEIYPLLVKLFEDGPKLNRDLLLHTCHLVYHNQVLKGNKDFKIQFFEENHSLDGDAVHVCTIAKARAFINYPDSEYLLNEKLVPNIEAPGQNRTLLEALVHYAHFSQINIKQNAFRVLFDYLRRI